MASWHLRYRSSGKPLIVRSAYSSPEHNRAVGGAARSKHMDGAAFDIAMSKPDPVAYEAAAREVMRRSRRVYPRSHRPKPPETRKAQTDGARPRLKRRLRPRHLNEIKTIPQTNASKSLSFSTKSAHFDRCCKMHQSLEKPEQPPFEGMFAAVQ